MKRLIKYLPMMMLLGAPAEAQGPRPGTICATPFGWCYLPAVFPIGSQCYCPAPRGVFYGVVR